MLSRLCHAVLAQFFIKYCSNFHSTAMGHLSSTDSINQTKISCPGEKTTLNRRKEGQLAAMRALTILSATLIRPEIVS